MAPVPIVSFGVVGRESEQTGEGIENILVTLFRRTAWVAVDRHAKILQVPPWIAKDISFECGSPFLKVRDVALVYDLSFAIARDFKLKRIPAAGGPQISADHGFL